MRGVLFRLLTSTGFGRSEILEVGLFQRDHLLRPFRLALDPIRFAGLRFQLVRRGTASI